MQRNVGENGRLPQEEIEAEERFDVTKQVSYGRLIYLRFLRNHAAVVAAFALVFIYLITLACPFFAPYDPNTRFLEKVAHPPLLPAFIDGDGQFHLRPFVFATVQSRDPKTMERIYAQDTGRRFPLRLFVRGDEYDFLFWHSDLHLFGAQDSPVFSSGHRHPGPRSLFPHPFRRPHLNHCRPDRRRNQPRSRHRRRHGIRLLGRCGRRRDPARHRGAPFLSEPAAVDGPLSVSAPALELNSHLSAHHHPAIDCRLGRPGARRARHDARSKI